MLKRSFAEFHAQKAQPESLEAMGKGQAALARVRAQPFPAALLGTSKEEVVDYHNITQDIDDISKELQVRRLVRANTSLNLKVRSSEINSKIQGENLFLLPQ